jgi:hypothetical protein
MAPPPSGEFQIQLSKPFSGMSTSSYTHLIREPKSSSLSTSQSQFFLLTASTGTPTQQIEIIGEPNRPASVRRTNYEGSGKSSEKKGDVPTYAFPPLKPHSTHPSNNSPATMSRN